MINPSLKSVTKNSHPKDLPLKSRQHPEVFPGGSLPAADTLFLLFHPEEKSVTSTLNLSQGVMIQCRGWSWPAWHACCHTHRRRQGQQQSGGVAMSALPQQCPQAVAEAGCERKCIIENSRRHVTNSSCTKWGGFAGNQYCVGHYRRRFRTNLIEFPSNRRFALFPKI